MAGRVLVFARDLLLSSLGGKTGAGGFDLFAVWVVGPLLLAGLGGRSALRWVRVGC